MEGSMRVVLLATIMLTLSTAANSGQIDRRTVAARKFDAQFLSSNQIRERLIGKSINGVQNGEHYSEFLNPNGSIEGGTPSGDPEDAYWGSWRILGNQLCLYFPSEGKKWDCTRVRLRGNQVIWDDNTTATLSGGAEQ
jgi:hypothetical protein